jgi:hypothetical protein
LGNLPYPIPIFPQLSSQTGKVREVSRIRGSSVSRPNPGNNINQEASIRQTEPEQTTNRTNNERKNNGLSKILYIPLLIKQITERIMILRKAALLLLPALATAYISDVNNAHIELLNSNGAPPSLDANNLEILLENQLWGDHTPSSIIAEFESWIERFERRYESLTEKGERLLVWLGNHGEFASIEYWTSLVSVLILFVSIHFSSAALIESHNAKQLSFTLSHNEYSDLTFDEFQSQMNLNVKPTLTKTKFNFVKHAIDAVAKEEAKSKLRGDASATSTERRLTSDDGQDWASMGLLGPIRNQGLCGACWAFSAVGSIESAMAIRKYNSMTPDEQSEEPDLVDVDSKGSVEETLGLVIPLSEQNLIDCDIMNQKGCDGGL